VFVLCNEVRTNSGKLDGCRLPWGLLFRNIVVVLFSILALAMQRMSMRVKWCRKKSHSRFKRARRAWLNKIKDACSVTHALD
jgi:hypothetical protein